MPARASLAAFGVALSLGAGAAGAQNVDPSDIHACTAIEIDSQRLACYDRATGRNALPAADKHEVEVDQHPNVFSGGDNKHKKVAAAPAPMSLLDSRWELGADTKLGTFNVRGYKPVYVMPFYVSDRTNNFPHSPNPGNTAEESDESKKVEQKFQLSFKTKVAQNIFGSNGDLWIAYTQSSRWQMYNGRWSRPFRETNYEPEALLVFNTRYRVFGWDGRLLGIGINHQSNGRGKPWSRSWNRIVANVGFERGDWVLMLRPWWRVGESRADDDNPDITSYMGRGEAQIVREWNGHEFALTMRHAFNKGTDRGATRFTWSFPVAGNLRGYMEFFNGYGESLIDYNHHANHFGLGISLLDWF